MATQAQTTPKLATPGEKQPQQKQPAKVSADQRQAQESAKKSNKGSASKGLIMGPFDPKVSAEDPTAPGGRGITIKLHQKQESATRKLFQGEAGAANTNLKTVDPEIFALIKQEEHRQKAGLELIASENFTSQAVMEAVGSCLTNKYSEGLPGKRYYGGTEVIDRLENLCKKRALMAFRLDPEAWAVNVQSYSGSTANFSAFTALLNPGERVMGLNLPDGGHLSHGFYSPKGGRAINASAMYFTSLPYYVDKDTGLVDYDDMESSARKFCPKLIVVGGSAYPRDWDYRRVRALCDSIGAKMMVDMAHYSGLVAAKVVGNPFEFADVVTSTTHKSLRSTRAALIFCKKELESAVNNAVFPGVQGGPHNHAIAGVAVSLKEACTPEFHDYSKRVVENAKVLASALEKKYGYKMATGGTDTHLILWDLRPLGLKGSRMDALCDAVAITLNKNTVHGDKSAMVPGGVRIGTPAMTTRGLTTRDFETVAAFLDEACKLALKIQGTMPPEAKKLKDFKEAMQVKEHADMVSDLRKRVETYSLRFEMPGKFL